MVAAPRQEILQLALCHGDHAFADLLQHLLHLLLLLRADRNKGLENVWIRHEHCTKERLKIKSKGIACTLLPTQQKLAQHCDVGIEVQVVHPSPQQLPVWSSDSVIEQAKGNNVTVNVITAIVFEDTFQLPVLLSHEVPKTVLYVLPMKV